MFHFRQKHRRQRAGSTAIDSNRARARSVVLADTSEVTALTHSGAVAAVGARATLRPVRGAICSASGIEHLSMQNAMSRSLVL